MSSQATSPTDRITLTEELADARTVEALWRLILGRSADNEAFLKDHDQKHTIAYWIKRLISSDEFCERLYKNIVLRDSVASGRKIGDLTLPASGEIVDQLFQLILGRKPAGREFQDKHHHLKSTEDWVRTLINSREFRDRFSALHGVPVLAADFVASESYRNPYFNNLEAPKAVLVVGSCMTEEWKQNIESKFGTTKIRHQLFNNASSLEHLDENELSQYAFQITQIPLRSIIFEQELFSTDYTDAGRKAIVELFNKSLTRLKRNLEATLRYNRQSGTVCFVLNFATPQANPLGRLFPRYELLNPVYFIEELNRALAELISMEKRVFLIDYDQITSCLGKRFILDDLTSHINHGSFIGSTRTEDDLDLTPFGRISDIYAPRPVEVMLAVFNECVATYDTFSPIERIKLVIFDLDGTLWRGVPAERDEVDGRLIEGWPLGVLEAAAYLKKRGVVLAIASKNDEKTVQMIWDKLYGHIFGIDNFAVVKLSWESKVESVESILAATNILSSNCLFVDDNPVEREKVQIAYPDMKVLRGPVVTWRRQLLWSVETQVADISTESAARTESIQSVIQREVLRKDVSESDYLISLQVKMNVLSIRSIDHPRFERALELLNKTNQFNTTGKRWSSAELGGYFSSGGAMLCGEVSDRLSNYGLTAVVLFIERECTQIVISCRIFGLHAEFALFNAFIRMVGGSRITIRWCSTGKNGPGRAFLHSVGVDDKLDDSVVGVRDVEFHAIS